MKRLTPLLPLASFILIVLPAILELILGSELILRVSADRDDDIQLKVSLLPGDTFNRVPSCIHTSGHLELRNTHQSEVITIHAMETVPGEWVKDGHAKEWLQSEDLQQIYVSKFGNRVINIEPRHSALIPITFYPQIPSYHNSNHRYNIYRSDKDIGDPSRINLDSEVQKDIKNPLGHSHLSKAAAADLADLAGKEYAEIGTNANEHFVRSNIIIQTSRGTLRAPLLGSAIRSNSYHIPHSILFFDDGFVSRGDTIYDDQAARLYYQNYNTYNGSSFEYDLYINNPSDVKELRIIEMFPSRTDLFQLKYSHHGSVEKGEKRLFRFNNCGPLRDESSYCNRPKAQDLSGPLIVPPGGRRAYICTVKLDETRWGAPSTESSSFLGYLHIRTTMDYLTIILESSTNKEVSVNKNIPVNLTSTSSRSPPLSKGSEENQQDTVILQGDDDELNAFAGGDKSSHEKLNGEILNDKRESGTKNYSLGKLVRHIPDRFPVPNHSEKSTKDGKISASHSLVDFGLITSANMKSSRGIHITNNGNIPLRLMRVTVGIDVAPELNKRKRDGKGPDKVVMVGKKEDDLALKIDVAIANDNPSDIISPGVTLFDAVVLVASSVPELPVTDDSKSPQFYSGSVIIRVGHADKTYSEWKEDVLRDPMAANEFVIETSFTASVMYGHIGYRIEDIYFPTEQLAGPTSKPSSSYAGGTILQNRFLDRTIYFSNFFSSPLRLRSIRIKEKTEPDSLFLSSEFCFNHFHITEFEGSEGNTKYSKLSQADSTEAWGGITLRYTFVNATDYERDLFRSPRRCTLTLETDLVGEFDIPLWIYSGFLEVKIEETVIPHQCEIKTSTSSAEKNKATSSEQKTGLECFQNFLNGTGTGKKIHSSLIRLFDLKPSESQNKKKSQKAENINDGKRIIDHINSYLKSLATGESDSSNVALEPIVLSIGAIGSDVVESFSIYVTNHNPLPVTLTATVPAVEGTEIRLGRTMDSVMNYIERGKTMLSDRTSEGGLKNFISMSSLPHNFFSKLRYRDDISFSTKAPKILKNLYNDNIVIRMHHDRLDASQSSDIIEYLDNPDIIDDQLSGKYGEQNLKLEKTKMKMHPPDFSSSTFPLHESSKRSGKKDESSKRSGKKEKEKSNIYKVDPILISIDGSTESRLSRVSQSEQTGPSWTIPPGGVARLEILVRSPPKHALVGRDITSFISTGVVMKTNFGQLMPVVVSYRALVGQLSVNTNPGIPHESNSLRNLNIPAIMRPPRSPKSIGSELSYSKKEVNSTQLYMVNTFSEDVVLKNVTSCNSWFQVVLEYKNILESDFTKNSNNSALGDYLYLTGASQFNASGTQIGFLQSLISCGSTSELSLISFYDCALQWLEKRESIQPPGCGMNPQEMLMEKMLSEGEDPENANESTIESLRVEALSRIKKVVAYLKLRYGEGREGVTQNIRVDPISLSSVSNQKYQTSNKNELYFPNRSNLFVAGVVSADVIESFFSAATAWDAISMLGLNVLTGNIRAKFEFSKNEDESSSKSSDKLQKVPAISTSISSPLLRANLDIPRVFYPREGYSGEISDQGNVLKFNLTEVSKISQVYVPVHNPSGFSIRVRLAVSSSSTLDAYPAGGSTTFSTSKSQDSIFVQKNGMDSNAWWTGGSYFLSDSEGSLMQAMHNVTIRSPSGAYLSLMNPSLHSSSAFVHGCAERRCGYRKDGTVVKDQPEKSSLELDWVSPIGAAAAFRERLRGRLYDSNGEETLASSSSQNSDFVLQHPPFALGMKSLDEITIPPFGVGQLGPIYFRPTSRRHFSGSLLLENSLTGLESVQIEGQGGWEKIIFIDNDVDGMNGGDLENRFGKSALVFPGSSKGSYGAVTKSVVVANVGDTTVKFDRVYLSPAEIPLFSSRKSSPGRHAHKDIYSSNIRSKCEERGFRLRGCYDDSTEYEYSWMNSLLRFMSSLPFSDRVVAFMPQFLINNPLMHRKTSSNRSTQANLRNGFSLAPNETRIIYISHTPDCTFRSMYIALNLEYGGDKTNLSQGLHRDAPKRHSLHCGDDCFKEKQLQLLLGYDLNTKEAIECVPALESLYKSSMKIRNVDIFHGNVSTIYQHARYWFGAQGSLDLFLRILPFLLFFFILIDIVSSSRQRQTSSILFNSTIETKSTAYKKILNPKIIRNESNNWASAFRCLSRMDPTSADLVHLGKEQTRQVVLGKYKKMSALQPQCLLPDGNFLRERNLISNTSGNVKGGSMTVKTFESPSSTSLSKRNPSGTLITLNESFFSHHQNFNDIAPTYKDTWIAEDGTPIGPILPCGLGWREATRRGIISNTSPDMYQSKWLEGGNIMNLLKDRQKIEETESHHTVDAVSAPRSNGYTVDAKHQNPKFDNEIIASNHQLSNVILDSESERSRNLIDGSMNLNANVPTIGSRSCNEIEKSNKVLVRRTSNAANNRDEPNNVKLKVQKHANKETDLVMRKQSGKHSIITESGQISLQGSVSIPKIQHETTQTALEKSRREMKSKSQMKKVGNTHSKDELLEKKNAKIILDKNNSKETAVSKKKLDQKVFDDSFHDQRQSSMNKPAKGKPVLRTTSTKSDKQKTTKFHEDKGQARVKPTSNAGSVPAKVFNSKEKYKEFLQDFRVPQDQTINTSETKNTVALNMIKDIVKHPTVKVIANKDLDSKEKSPPGSKNRNHKRSAKQEVSSSSNTVIRSTSLSRETSQASGISQSSLTSSLTIQDGLNSSHLSPVSPLSSSSAVKKKVVPQFEVRNLPPPPFGEDNMSQRSFQSESSLSTNEVTKTSPEVKLNDAVVVKEPSSPSRHPTKTIRPPPGLAPPPGFVTDAVLLSAPNHTNTIEGTSTNVLHDSLDDYSEQSQAQEINFPHNSTFTSTGNNKDILGEVLPGMEGPGKSLLSVLLADDENQKETTEKKLTQYYVGADSHGLPIQHNATTGCDDLISSLVKNVAEASPPLGGGDDFNVMNLLNFLDDPIQGQVEVNDLDKSGDGGSLKDPNDNLNSQGNYQPTAIGIPADPWSGTRTYHALAYGIEIENPSAESVQDMPLLRPIENSRTGNGGLAKSRISLLTPALILGNEEDEEVDKKDDTFNYDDDAFYSSLLGE